MADDYKTIKNGLDDSKPKKNGHELPPTPADAQMSVRHHKDSVAYNLRHSKDHFAATIDHVERMRGVAGDKAARTQAKKACAMLDEMHNRLAPYLQSSSSPQATSSPASPSSRNSRTPKA